MAGLSLVILLREYLLIPVDVMIVVSLVIGLITLFIRLLVLGLVDRQGRFLNNGHNGLEDLLLLDVVFLIGPDDVGDVWDCGLDIPSHDVDGPQMVDLRQLKQLRLLLISVLLH